MSFPRYPAYKDSRDPMIGQVPEHWTKTALKHLATYQNGYPFKPEDWGDSGRPIIRIAQLTGSAEPDRYAGTLDERVSVQDGDLLFSWSATLDSFFWRGEPAWLNQHIFKVTPSKEATHGFLYYLIKFWAPKLADVDAHGSTMRHIKKESLGQSLFVPPLDEQSCISTFLDHETAKIDALVAEQERLIELLKEKRQAVISHAVTKGLDQSVPMKDSGVEWLGEVPAHWEVTHLKRRCTLITDGAHISPDTEGGVHFFVSTKDISDGGIDFDGALKTSPTSYEYMVKTGCQPRSGDVLFSKDGTIGRTVVVDGATEFVIASSLIIIRPDSAQLESSFLNALCQSWVIGQQVDGFVKGAGLPRLSIQNLLKVTGVFPPIDEQRQIARHLGVRDAYFRNLAQEAERTVSLLKERRTALISAAVTGQIDVRSFVPAEAVE